MPSGLILVQIPQKIWLSPPKSDSKQTRSTSQSSRSGDNKQPGLATKSHAKQESGQKHKRPRVDEDLGNQNQDKPPLKRTRISSTERAKGAETQEEKRDKPYNPVKHWVEAGHWSESFLEMDPKSSEGSSENKRKRKSTPSYSQSVRNGENPKAYSREYEKHLRDNGIFMDLLKAMAWCLMTAKIFVLVYEVVTAMGPSTPCSQKKNSSMFSSGCVVETSKGFTETLRN